MKKLGMALVVSLMASTAFAGGPVVVIAEPEPVVVVGAAPSSALGGLTGTTLAAGLGALLLLGLVLGSDSSSSTPSSTE